MSSPRCILALARPALVGSVSLALMLGGSCKKSAHPPAGGTPVSAADLNRIKQTMAKHAATKAKILRHSKEAGYNFDFCLLNDSGNSPLEIGRGGSMLTCRGVATGARAIEIENDLKKILAPEELDGMDICFEMDAAGKSHVLGSARLFAEEYERHAERERVEQMVRTGTGIDFSKTTSRYEVGRKGEFVQYGVDETNSVRYLVVATQIDRPPLIIVRHWTDSSGGQWVTAKLEIDGRSFDPPDVSNNAVFCSGTTITRVPMASISEESLLDWIRKEDGLTPETLVNLAKP